uniref:myosin-binding protein C, cardiac-type-like isoform X2 n=1 Tax=Myxine glutinosa TaxID=7769 RepID=UPI00358DFC92
MPVSKQAAVFSITPTDVSVEVGSKAEFLAETGRPGVKVKWQKDGKDLPRDARYSTSAKGKSHCLIISNVTINDAGSYALVAGMTKSPFKLSIKDPVPTPDKKTPAEPVPPSEPDVLPQMKEERDTPQAMAGLFLEKIEDAHVHVGGDHLFTAKVDGSKFTTRPQVQWFKGKWMDLSSKAGKHLQFKDTFDKNTKIYTFEMNMIKAKEMHTGKYRCEISHKGTKDSCSFDVNITAPLGEEMDIRKAFKRVGKEKKEDAGEMDFSALLKKREKKVVEEPTSRAMTFGKSSRTQNHQNSRESHSSTE